MLDLLMLLCANGAILSGIVLFIDIAKTASETNYQLSLVIYFCILLGVIIFILINVLSVMTIVSGNGAVPVTEGFSPADF